MEKNKFYKYACIAVSLLLGVFLNAQSVTLFGKIQAEDNLENIHVANINKNTYTTTNALGIFKIEAQKNDTLSVTSIQYQPATIIITQTNINDKSIQITLAEQINELQEVIVGNILSGNLEQDINSSKAKPKVNFYNVGIPGYEGKPKTHSEIQLNEATTGGFIPLNPILNAISGRTKMLKKRIALEANTALMYSLKSRLSEDFFSNNPLEEDKRMDFFYFCTEDKDFEKHCSKSDLEALAFMKKKYIKYKENLASKE